MSSESDSELFFDAEDITPIKTAKKKEKKRKSSVQDETLLEEVSDSNAQPPSSSEEGSGFSVIQVNQEDIKEAERKVKENEKRRRKVEELRNKLKEEEEILEVPSEQSSLASSVEGIYPTNNIIHPKVINANTEESKSVMSLGKVGSILGGKTNDPDTISTDSKYSLSGTGTYCDDWNTSTFLASSTMLSCQEPDLVASTKGERSGTMPRPVVPPRRKRKNKVSPATLAVTDDLEPASVSPALTPTDPVESLAREIECCSLDLKSATRGEYVVKPQDREQDRVVCPEHLFKDLSPQADNSKQPSPESSIASKKEDETPQPYMVRTRTDSGRPLTDQEILEQVRVVNLDTGEQIPLSLAEEHLPKCLNPLSLHIMRLTSEYVSNTALDKERESDEESIDSKKTHSLAGGAFSRYKGIGKRIGRNIENSDLIRKLKNVADKVHHAKHGDEDASDEEATSDPRSNVEVKVSSKLRSVDKGRSEFEKIRVVQELSGEHSGAIWTMKFSSCGRLLATAGQDHDLRIWVLRTSFKYFDDMRIKNNAEGKSSPTPSQESTLAGSNPDAAKSEDSDNGSKGPFVEEPFCRYKGHTAELLDVSWSKNLFILSSSMDKTVRLWHISRPECLCCFQHIDFVTSIAFHPRDDRYFLSGSLDGKLRFWNIPDKKVTLWHELEGQTKLITAVNFCRNGKIAVVGSYEGRCIFYHTEQLKYHTQIHVRSSRGKNKQGRKISGIEAMPGEDKILVTSNDSRIRLYDIRDLSLSCKYKGYVNLSSQIKASFSHDGRYIISGSENQFIYIWKTFHDYAKTSRRDRNDYWERIKAHNAVVTSAVFSPNPSIILEQLEREQDDSGSGQSSADLSASTCYVIVSADFCGTIKVFLHKSRAGASDVS